MKITPFVERLSIVDKSLQQHRLSEVMNWAQYRILEEVEAMTAAGLPVRIIVLKARQMGVSTIINAIQFTMAFMMNRMRGLIVSHELDSSEHLLSMVNHYWETFLFRDLYTQKNKSAKHLSWGETKSSIRIVTAKNIGAARSQTIQFLHASEVGFWENGEALMTGMQQTIPSLPFTFIAQESTANGVGNYFHSQWMAALNNEIDFKPLFFPWWKHPEYRAENLRLPTTLPTGMDEDERILYAVLTDLMSRDEAESRLVWRRWKIKNDCQNSLDVFHQEYPSTDDEAFLSTGRNIFPLEKLRECYDYEPGFQGEVILDGHPGAFNIGTRVKFVRSTEGRLTVYRAPAPDCAYVVVCDPTRTTMGDYGVIQILNRYTWEQVAVWRGKIDPAAMGDEAIKLALYYNDALINVEINGPGWATIGRITGTDYPYVWFRQEADAQSGAMQKKHGWHSSQRKKPEIVGYLLNAIVEGDIVIHHDITYRELINYIVKDSGEYGNASKDGFDDCVTSLALAVGTMVYEASSLPPPGTIRRPSVAADALAMLDEYYKTGGAMDVEPEMLEA